MAKIAVLDKNMINMIAAGEVIERPASVLKEMLENSIDAGAKRIVIRIEDGGKKLISITDDGCGISAEDIPTAFEPHATSKIKTIDDLNAISSMGFRGEALASIASVAKVKIISRTAESIGANSMEIDCGTKTQVFPSSGDYGTTIEVRDLFYRLPARQKFLKTSSTEMNHITEHFTRIALSHPQLDLTLFHNDRQLYHLLSRPAFMERISELMPKQISADLISVYGEEKQIKISAMIGKPCIARSSTDYQYVFLNGRYIRDTFIIHALKEAYRGLTEPNRHPVAFMFLEMPYDSYDVNVHPTKVEVRFDNSNLVHSQVLGILREKLLSMNLDINASLPQKALTVKLETQTPVEDQHRQERIREAMENFFKKQDVSPAMSSQKSFDFTSSGSSCSFNSNSVSSSPRRNYKPDQSSLSWSSSDDKTCNLIKDAQTNQLNQTSEVMQIHNSYIITQTEDGFAVIDQHAMHERIIYEKLCDKIFGEHNSSLQSQRLLIPETIEVTPGQQDVIERNDALFLKLGIEIESFGPSTFAIHSFPVILSKVSPADFMENLLGILCSSVQTPDTEKIIHEVLDMAACKAAIKAGQPLSQLEIAQLLSDKQETPRSSRCPHGRPTTIRFTLGDLEKQFKRTGF